MRPGLKTHRRDTQGTCAEEGGGVATDEGGPVVTCTGVDPVTVCHLPQLAARPDAKSHPLGSVSGSPNTRPEGGTSLVNLRVLAKSDGRTTWPRKDAWLLRNSTLVRCASTHKGPDPGMGLTLSRGRSGAEGVLPAVGPNKNWIPLLIYSFGPGSGLGRLDTLRNHGK